VPTHGELIQLVKYWVSKAIGDEYFIFSGQCFGSSDLRRLDFDWNRVNEIAQVLGEAETDKAVKEAYDRSCARRLRKKRLDRFPLWNVG